jgi:hypothetical protein
LGCQRAYQRCCAPFQQQQALPIQPRLPRTVPLIPGGPRCVPAQGVTCPPPVPEMPALPAPMNPSGYTGGPLPYPRLRISPLLGCPSGPRQPVCLARRCLFRAATIPECQNLMEQAKQTYCTRASASPLVCETLACQIRDECVQSIQRGSMYCWSPQWFLRPLWQDTTLAPYGVGSGAGPITNVMGTGPVA